MLLLLAFEQWYQFIMQVNLTTATSFMNFEDQSTVEDVGLLYSSTGFFVCSMVMSIYSLIRKGLLFRREFERHAHLKI